MVSGCENPGQIGSAIIEDDTRVVVDTLGPIPFEEHSFISYSGNHTWFSAGEFNDPLLGNTGATGMLRPILDTDSDDPFTADSEMQLLLDINREQVYGDTAATAQYDLLEVASLWRGNAWKWNEPITTVDDYTVGTFTVGTEEEVLVDLADEWVDKYRNFYNRSGPSTDSLYRYTFHGLAIVPRNTGKVVPFNAAESAFVVDSTGEDSFEIPLNQWAYSLERSADNLPDDRTGIHSTLENIISVDLQAATEVGTVNISRAELVLYADTVLMEQTLDQAAPTADRPRLPVLRLHRVRSGTAPESIDPGNAAVVAQLEDGAYRFNLTSLIKGGFLADSEEFRYYITASPHNGLLQSTVLFNDQAVPDRTPKLIVTSIQTVEN